MSVVYRSPSRRTVGGGGAADGTVITVRIDGEEIASSVNQTTSSSETTTITNQQPLYFNGAISSSPLGPSSPMRSRGGVTSSDRPLQARAQLKSREESKEEYQPLRSPSLEAYTTPSVPRYQSRLSTADTPSAHSLNTTHTTSSSTLHLPLSSPGLAASSMRLELDQLRSKNAKLISKLNAKDLSSEIHRERITILEASLASSEASLESTRTILAEQVARVQALERELEEARLRDERAVQQHEADERALDGLQDELNMKQRETSELQTELYAQIADLKDKQQLQIEELTNQIQTLQMQLDDSNRQFHRGQEQHEHVLKQSLKDQSTQLNQEHTNELTRISQEHSTLVIRMKHEFATQMSNVRDEYANQITSLNEDARVVKENYENQINNLTENHSIQIRELEEVVQYHKSREESAEASHVQSMKDKDNAYQMVSDEMQRLSARNSELHQENANLRNEHAELRANNHDLTQENKQLESQARELRETLQTLRLDQERDNEVVTSTLKTLEKEHQDALDQKENALQQLRAQLIEESEGHEQDVRKLQLERSQLMNRIGQLEEACERLKDENSELVQASEAALQQFEELSQHGGNNPALLARVQELEKELQLAQKARDRHSTQNRELEKQYTKQLEEREFYYNKTTELEAALEQERKNHSTALEQERKSHTTSLDQERALSHAALQDERRRSNKGVGFWLTLVLLFLVGFGAGVVVTVPSSCSLVASETLLRYGLSGTESGGWGLHV